jgi:two-component system, OmpR family, sensor histidine kinase ChvG
MNDVRFRDSVQSRLLVAALVLLLIPASGVLFVRELNHYLRLGQEQVTVTSAKLIAASLSDRPALARRLRGKAEVNANVDVDTDAQVARERERVIALFSASDASLAASLGARYQPDAGVERILNQSVGTNIRVWVIDISGNVSGIAGALQRAPTADPAGRWLPRLSRALGIDSDSPSTRRVTDVTAAADNALMQAERALLGQANTEWRLDAIDTITVFSVAEPIWQADSIVGAVVVEQEDSAQRALTRTAAQLVLMLSLALIIAAFGLLLWLGWRFTRRLTQLQRDANAAVDAHGRVIGVIHPSAASDEIGALSRTLDAMVTRQSRYSAYLEKLGARLSHELRTPVAVVRSSLDNLRQSTFPDQDRKYLERADEGVARLSSLISRLSEATQLEQMLQGAERLRLDMGELIDGCVAGYQLAFAQQQFVFTRPTSPCWAIVAPDTIAQMLDKLIENALDFATPGTPIVIRLADAAASPATTPQDLRHQRADDAQFMRVSVENSGPALPADAQSLFESMVSVREGHQQSGHLGLGLYVVKLVAEFHDGRVGAANLNDGSGVVIWVDLPIAGKK